MYTFLRKISLFADLSNSDLERLCEMVEEVHLPAHEMLFAEGSSGDRAYIIKAGELDILKASGEREVLLATRGRGDVIGEMALLEDAPRSATVRARTDSVLLAIQQEQLDHLLDTSPSAARAMLATVTARLRANDALLRQSEKMAQLGTLTAGVAHELNNPAAAVQRGSGQLRTIFAQFQEASIHLNELNIPASQEVMAQAQRAAAQLEGIDPLTRSDREYELETWLDERGVDNAWECAPVLVNLGYDTDRLAALADNLDPAQLMAVIRWVSATYSVYSLLEEIGQGAGRIAEIVKALKTYSYLDQAPVQAVDVREGLDNTLVMLRSKLKGGITVHREYAEQLPSIQAYGSELNQVWTNIIDNAADAMQGKGEIIIRAYPEAEWVVVEIQDNGPGIPEKIQSKIFDPFFTTKPPGHGTGLGLNISYNIVVQKHRGDIQVYSQPGKTCFRVRLPLNFDTVAEDAPPVEAFSRVSDEELRQILQTTQNIAVVGISDHEDRPAYTIPLYLKEQGYRIIPVNPRIEQLWGEKSYPDLAAVPERVDTVLIFRRAEEVPPIVEQAIQIGAKTVWMQEGIINEAAGRTAREAGLNVVMDTCMRNTHKRLILAI